MGTLAPIFLRHVGESQTHRWGVCRRPAKWRTVVAFAASLAFGIGLVACSPENPSALRKRPEFNDPPPPKIAGPEHSMPREKAEAFLPLIQRGMTFAEICEIAPSLRQAQPFYDPDGFAWYEAGISREYYLHLQFEPLESAQDPERRQITRSPRLRDRRSGLMLRGEEKRWFEPKPAPDPPANSPPANSPPDQSPPDSPAPPLPESSR